MQSDSDDVIYYVVLWKIHIFVCQIAISETVREAISMKQVDEPIDVVALSQGSVKAFDTLFMSYYPRVKSFLYGLTGDGEAAEDLAQDHAHRTLSCTCGCIVPPCGTCRI